MTGKLESLYVDRKFSDGYPDLEARGATHFATHQATESEALQVMTYISRLTDLPVDSRIVVVGCGPKPDTLAKLVKAGHKAVGVEPIAAYVETANRWLEGHGEVFQGAAESLPFEDGSCQVVISESVLEHVDSPQQTVAEAYRVLAPGGILYLQTTNRYRISLTGNNGEFTTRFFNWFPQTVKESYIHHHLHFDPTLANYTPRPAVHWFSYAELCALGRQAGFARFYSKMDVMQPGDPAAASWLRRKLLPAMKYRPLIRSLALLQYGSNVFMVKRGTLA